MSWAQTALVPTAIVFKGKLDPDGQSIYTADCRCLFITAKSGCRHTLVVNDYLLNAIIIP